MDIDTKRSSIIEIFQEKREPDENENENWTSEEIPTVSCLDTENKLPTIVQKLQEEKASIEKEIEKRRLKGVLSHLGETSSLHGISKLASSRQVIVKLIWCCVFIVTCIVFVVQIYELFKTFYSYPIQTTVKLDFSSIAFPAITICNMNPIKNGKLSMVPQIKAVLEHGRQNKTIPNAESTTSSQALGPPSLGNGSVNTMWQLFHHNLLGGDDLTWLNEAFEETFFLSHLDLKKDQWEERTEDFGIVFKNESVEKRQEIGHQKDDLIVATTFAGRIQNSTDYKHFPSTLYGNCYTITSPKYVALGSGPAHGIKLTVNLEKDDYVPIVSTSYGARVVFHEPGIHPLPSHEGITLSPSTETNIGLRMVRISRLGEPHGNCDDGIKFFQRYNRRYSIAACHEFCRIRKITEKCDCIPVDAPDGIDLNSTALPVCDTRLQSVKACLDKIDIHFDSSGFGCNCKGPCNETLFTKTMSSSYWPTDDYLSVLMADMCEMYETPYWNNLCNRFQYMPVWEVDRFRQNFLRMTVYFEDLNYESITEEPLYESVRFLSDIGGASGLFLGASVISLVEVFQLLLELFLILKANHTDKNKARMLPQN